MKDLRVITAKARLAIYSISPVREFYPPSILVLGKDLFKTVEVEVNGVLTTDFIVSDQGRLVVRIPESQVGQPLTSIQAYTSVSTDYASAEVSFGITAPFRTVRGIDRLVQAWLLLFFSTPGTDIFSKGSGGGARSLIGRSTDANHQSAAADLALCIDRTRVEMLRLQSGAIGVPMDERLLSSSLDGVSFDPISSVLSARVSITSMTGSLAQLSLG